MKNKRKLCFCVCECGCEFFIFHFKGLKKFCTLNQTHKSHAKTQEIFFFFDYVGKNLNLVISFFLKW